MRSGWLLLELLDRVAPGSVDWAAAHRPPLAPRAALPHALENCAQALAVARGALGLPLVSFSHYDVALGRAKKPILSLVYQVMRFGVFQTLASLGGGSGGESGGGGGDGDDGGGARNSTSGGDGGGASEGGSGASTPRRGVSGAGSAGGAGGAGGGIVFSSSSRKQRRLAVTEQDVLAWANAAIASLGDDLTRWRHAAPAHLPPGWWRAPREDGGGGGGGTSGSGGGGGPLEAVPAAPIRSFRDPSLATGVAALQVLAAVVPPGSVDPARVAPGATKEEREANARYALAVARRAGVGLPLTPADVAAVRPRLMLVLFASLMAFARRRRQQQQQEHGQQQQEQQECEAAAGG